MNTSRSASELRGLLSRRYRAPTWALLHEVPDGTGMAKSRTADALAMGLWPSRGLELHGVELKASRRDWLKELRTPYKAEAFVGYCDRWFVVATPGVVVLDEVPENWGVLLAKGKRGLVVEKEAPKLEPAPIDRAFLAALLRRVVETEGRHLDERLRACYSEGRENGLRSASAQDVLTIEELSRVRTAVADFESASGISISEYGGARIGEQVRAYLDATRNPTFIADGLKRHASLLEEALAKVRDAVNALERRPE